MDAGRLPAVLRYPWPTAFTGGGPSRRTTTPDPAAPEQFSGSGGSSAPRRAGQSDRPVATAGHVQLWREPTGNANGLARDGQSRVVACEQGKRRVSRIEADGTRAVLADRYQGKRLNSPNDVVVKSDGSVYFTDPPLRHHSR